MTMRGVHKLEERRHLRIACLGYDHERILRLSRLCADVCRPDDGFEFMIDASKDAAAAYETAVAIEMFWSQLPNPSLAHLCDHRHVLLLGADLVADFSECGHGGVSESDEIHRQPEILDWSAPRPRSAARHDALAGDEESRRSLLLDMSLLCPRALMVRIDPRSESLDKLVSAVVEALRRVQEAHSNR